MAPRRKYLVIDADVARSAGGEEAADIGSKARRGFLLAVREVCHAIAMSDPIRREWDQHQSRFAGLWRRSMVAKRKFRYLTDTRKPDLWTRIQQLQFTERELRTLEKDWHLVEAALSADRIVVSGDLAVRELLLKASASIPELRDLIWIDPQSDWADEWFDWLRSGAPHREAQTLGRLARELRAGD